MKIVSGRTGSPHVTSQQFRQMLEGIIGQGSYIITSGENLKPELSSNNLLKIRSGMMAHHGCISCVDIGTYDEVTLTNGSQGMKRIDLIVNRYTRNAETEVENCSWKVIHGTPVASNPAVPAYTSGNLEPTTNREDECAIVEHAFSEDYVRVEIPERNGKTVAVIGAGPAGLVAANQLNHKGYKVTVFEARENAGGLLRYGIPNFKLNKSIIDRRLHLLEEEGIEFKYNQHIDVNKLPEGFDAYVVSTGTPTARDLKIPGRELKGVYFALELLSQQNRILAGMEFSKDELVNCKGKDVLVIGGGDTGSDCIGTAHRQGCKSVTQIEIMPKPVEGPEDPKNPWPNWPRTLKTTSSHEEGCTRRWNINSLEFLGKNGKLTGVKVQQIDWKTNPEGGRPLMVEAGKPEIIKAEAVFLAMGFLKPQQPEFADNVFVAGDAANGASLVVRAMASGRKIAAQVDKYLNK